MPVTKKLIQHEFDKFTGDSSIRIVGSTGQDISSVTAPYSINNIDDGNTTANITYIGKVKEDGTYYIQKINETTSTLPVFTYATVSNNPGTTTYASAWTNRATLTYDVYQTAF